MQKCMQKITSGQPKDTYTRHARTGAHLTRLQRSKHFKMCRRPGCARCVHAKCTHALPTGAKAMIHSTIHRYARTWRLDTNGTIAANGLVYVGNAGGDQVNVTGHVYALDAKDGHMVWRFDVVPGTGPARATWTNPKYPISMDSITSFPAESRTATVMVA
jgi:hypothetical protein